MSSWYLWLNVKKKIWENYLRAWWSRAMAKKSMHILYTGMDICWNRILVLLLLLFFFGFHYWSVSNTLFVYYGTRHLFFSFLGYIWLWSEEFYKGIVVFLFLFFFFGRVLKVFFMLYFSDESVSNATRHWKLASFIASTKKQKKVNHPEDEYLGGKKVLRGPIVHPVIISLPN